jgi:hypothetical protein
MSHPGIPGTSLGELADCIDAQLHPAGSAELCVRALQSHRRVDIVRVERALTFVDEVAQALPMLSPPPHAVPVEGR